MPLLLSSVRKMWFLLMLKSWLLPKWSLWRAKHPAYYQCKQKGKVACDPRCWSPFSIHSMDFLYVFGFNHNLITYEKDQTQTPKMKAVRFTEERVLLYYRHRKVSCETRNVPTLPQTSYLVVIFLPITNDDIVCCCSNHVGWSTASPTKVHTDANISHCKPRSMLS